MKAIILAGLILGLSAAHAQTRADALPSCNLTKQRSLVGALGGTIKDPGQAHISMRANVLQADISTARKARQLSQRTADRLWREVQHVRVDTNDFTQKQGFLSAAERASYDRDLDAVAAKICPGTHDTAKEPNRR